MLFQQRTLPVGVCRALDPAGMELPRMAMEESNMHASVEIKDASQLQALGSPSSVAASGVGGQVT